MNEQSEPNCGQCRYFKLVEAMSGTCHRFPPIFAGDSSPRETHHWRFPMVGHHAWCGEFLAQNIECFVSPAGSDQATPSALKKALA